MFRKMEAHNVRRVDDAIRALKNGLEAAWREEVRSLDLWMPLSLTQLDWTSKQLDIAS